MAEAETCTDSKSSCLMDGLKSRESSEHEEAKEVPSGNPWLNMPDGGLQAWLAVAGTFCLWFSTWGFVNSYGVFQTYYQIDLLRFSTPDAISWIGSMQSFLLLFISLLSGPLYDMGYNRTLLCSGAFFIVLGQMMLSLCTQYWQIFLAQGLMVGIGFGLLFVPIAAVLSTYFSTRLPLAGGIASAGSGLGGILWPIAFHRLQPQVGFPWAARVLGFVSFTVLVLAVVLTKPRLLPPVRRQILNFSALADLSFMSYSLSGFFTYTGLYVPLVYIQLYAIQTDIVSPDVAFYLVPILNAASTIGRFSIGYAAVYAGPINLFICCNLMVSVLCFCLIGVHSGSAIIIITILYGFFSGAMVGLGPTNIVVITKDRSTLGTRVGMAFAITGLGLLIGNPISGAILHASSGDFVEVWVFGGVMTTIGTLFAILLRGSHGGWNLVERV